ncbi:MAG: signal recognition particle-docking protein FtsY [Desulfomonilaceae bacterium]
MSEDKPEKRGFLKRIFKRGGPDVKEEKGKSAAEEETYRSEVANVETAESAVTEAELMIEKPEEKEKTDLVRLEKGLQKTRSSFLKNLNRIFVGRRELDQDISAQLEEILVKADIGVKTTFQLLESVTERMKRREFHDPQAIVAHLKSLIMGILVGVEEPLKIRAGVKPFVVMMIGVNGSGKTTTMAKIAAQHKNNGKSVLLVAADTFRAAAVEQLEIWGARVGCPVVKGKEKADPSSVVFEAVDRAMKESIDIVLVDTAGRLHTRVPLMEELKKVKRTLAKKIPDAPHETLLVIDASTGQNAILQATTFNEAIPVTGVALTKLDGTAKGGVIVGISNELKIPIRYIGIGEKMDDLREFSAGHFVEALFTTAD